MPDFRVDDYTGTDSQRYAQAHSAALAVIAQHPTIILPSRELRPTSKLALRWGISLRGDGGSIMLDYPGAAAPAGNAPQGIALSVYNPPAGAYTRIEGFRIEGRPTGYYRLIEARDVPVGTAELEPALEMADVEFGVCGQSFLELRNVKEGLLSFAGRYGGDNSYDLGVAKYKVSVIGCEEVVFDGLELGDPTHDRNQSFLTVNSASRSIIVRDSVFYGSRTYCLNTHGQASSDIWFEGNELRPGPNAKYGAVLVGNEAWGADTDVHLVGNTMVGEGRFLQMRSKLPGSKSEAFLDGNAVPAEMSAADFITFGPGGGLVHVSG